MIAVPAVDVRGGRCVQLVGGRPEEERVSLPDPAAVALRWWELGFRSLHVVDLDAALGEGENGAVIRDLARRTRADLQVGGGVRDASAVDRLLGDGARRVVVGTRAVDDRAWLRGLAERHPGRVVVAADVREGRVLRRGWTEESGLEMDTFLSELEGIPLAGILCTDVGREGRMTGVNEAEIRRVLEAAPHPLWVSGGIRSIDDLRRLAEVGAHGAVLGMALYTGTLDAEAVAEEFGA